jgi:hypothetical protein
MTDFDFREWVRITASHPDHGNYEMDVHCLRSPATGEINLIVFNDQPREKQLETVKLIASNTGQVIEPLRRGDVSNDLADLMANTFHTAVVTPPAVVISVRSGPGGKLVAAYLD